jgi:hypothetical protein
MSSADIRNARILHAACRIGLLQTKTLAAKVVDIHHLNVMVEGSPQNILPGAV